LAKCHVVPYSMIFEAMMDLLINHLINYKKDVNGNRCHIVQNF